MDDQNIVQTRRHADEAQSLERQPDNQSLDVYTPRRWRAVVASLSLLLIAGGGGYSIWWASLAFIANSTARMTFIMGSSLNLAILVAIVAQACIYWGQRNLMERSLERTDRIIETMQGQLVAVQDQVEIMEGQAKSMDQSVVFGLRAYVGIHSMEIELEEKKQIVVQIENIGKVPASEIKVAGELEVTIARGCISDGYKPSKWSTPQAINRLRVPLARDYGHTKLFPGNLKIKINVSLSRYLTDGEISLVRQGDARLIIRGNINFNDGFNKDKNSPFAFRYSKRAQCCLPHPIESPDEDWQYKPGEDDYEW